MKFCDALALARRGWYLLTPPITPCGDGRYRIDEAAPLSKWQNGGGFDSADDGTRLKYLLNSGLQKKYGKDVGSRLARLVFSEGTYQVASDSATLNAQRIATDDPRLKESSK